VSERPESRPRRSRFPLALIAAALIVVVASIVMLISLYSSPGLSAADASATAEAHQFATAEVARQSTAVSVRRTSTASARATGTAQAVARTTREVASTATEAARIESTATALALASAVAPATHTAQAIAFEERRAQAEIVTQQLEAQVTQVFGPSSGSLDHNIDNTPTCALTGLVLHNFIASARIYNPYSAAQHPWDHGITFSNEGEDTSYSLLLRSSGQYTLKLAGPAFHIELNESTDLLDLSRPGDNTLKLYLHDDVAYIYINNLYADTIHLRDMSLGQATDTNHHPQLCINLDEGSAQQDATTRYEDFTVWSLP
jgi:hypothetical protein